MKLQVAAATAAMFFLSLTARADTFQTFNASGYFPDGSTLGGTLTIDTTRGFITASNIIVGAPDSTIETIVNSQSPNLFGDGRYGAKDESASGDDFYFSFAPPDTLVGYAGGTIKGNLFDTRTGEASASLVTGSFAAMTPEPSAFVLLGTGLLGLVRVMRQGRD